MSGAGRTQDGKRTDPQGGASVSAPDGGSLGFALGGIRLEVEGRTAHHCDDTWDANWLSVTATCSAAGAEVVVPEAVVTSWSVDRFCAALEGLVRTGVGSAYLAAESPSLTMRVESQVADAPIMVRAELTADSAGQGHWFAFPVGREELRGVIARCQEILVAHPANQMAD